MKNLVIVESNAKAKTIEKYLSCSEELKDHGTFKVVASLGHIVDLPPKEMGIDMDNWQMKYVPIAGKSGIIQNLKGLIKSHDMIYLAADPDREGEAIAKNIYDVFNIKSSKTKRVTFNEITKHAIIDAIRNPREIDSNLVDAQEARRILDRVVGYKLSPLLWRRFAGAGLSAGRVQSVALKILVDRSKEIEEFTPVPIWKVFGTFLIGEDKIGSNVDAVLEEPLKEKRDVESLMKELARKGIGTRWFISFTLHEIKTNPMPPFVTSTLQQEAYNRYRIPAKKTMQLAQVLYEGGYITYMRTDSTNISKESKIMIHSYIASKYGNEDIVDRDYKTRVANAQEAHECIRPTNIEKTSRDIMSEKITQDHRKLYDLVWRRAVASQMPSAIYIELRTLISASKNDMPVLDGRSFRGSSRVLVEKGYLKVWQPDVELQTDIAEVLKERAKRSNNDATPIEFYANGDMTSPATMYNEPSLVKMLEKKGIGRPSTYSTIIDKLYSKGYVVLGMSPQTTVDVVHYKTDLVKKKVLVEEETIFIGGKEKDRIVPTLLGKRVISYLEEVTPEMVDVSFTAGMEELLDHISNKQIRKGDMLDEFYKKFHNLVEEALKKQKEASGMVKKLKGEEKSPIRPNNVLRKVSDDIDIVQTRYGMALFSASDKRFINLSSFMKWKSKTINNINMMDIEFLRRLPITVNCPVGKENIDVHIGPYGLYAKMNDKNYGIPKDIWEDIYYGKGILYNIISKSLIPTKNKK